MEGRLRTLQNNLSAMDCRQISTIDDDRDSVISQSMHPQVPALSATEKNFLIQKANESCAAVIQHSRTLSGPDQWQSIGKHRGVVMYRGEAPPMKDVNAKPVPTYSRQFVCGIMTMVGSIDDVAAYFDQSTTADMRVKQADDIVDCRVLYSLQDSQANTPFHRVAVKYMAWQAPAALTHVRDLCYLECQNVFQHSSGKRGWVLSMHSIELPSCPARRGIIRSSIYNSGYVFLESDVHGYLHVLHTLQINFKGHLPNFVVNQALRKRVASMTEIGDELIKLRLRSKKLLEPQNLPLKESRTSCSACFRRFNRIFLRKTWCRVCGEVLCQKCAPAINIRDQNDPIGKYSDVKLRVCNTCLRKSSCLENSVSEYSRANKKEFGLSRTEIGGDKSAWKHNRSSDTERHANTVLNEMDEVDSCDLLSFGLPSSNNVFHPSQFRQEGPGFRGMDGDDDVTSTFVWAPSPDSTAHRNVDDDRIEEFETILGHQKEQAASAFTNLARIEEKEMNEERIPSLFDYSSSKADTARVGTLQNLFQRDWLRRTTSTSFLWNRDTKSVYQPRILSATFREENPQKFYKRSSMTAFFDTKSWSPCSTSSTPIRSSTKLDRKDLDSSVNKGRRRSLSCGEMSDDLLDIPVYTSDSDASSEIPSPNCSDIRDSDLNFGMSSDQLSASSFGGSNYSDESDIRDRKSSYGSLQRYSYDCHSVLSDSIPDEETAVLSSFYRDEDDEDCITDDDSLISEQRNRCGSSFDYAESEDWEQPYEALKMDVIQHFSSVNKNTASPTTSSGTASTVKESMLGDSTFHLRISDRNNDIDMWRDSESMRFAHEQHQCKMEELQRKIESLERHSFYGSSYGSNCPVNEVDNVGLSPPKP